MDMGTGKTRVAFELVKHRFNRISNVVYYCPVASQSTIEYEIKKHTEGQSVFNFTPNKKYKKSFWNIIGIESMSSCSKAVFLSNKIINSCSFVIVDESSYIKGAFSKRTRMITFLSERSLYRLIMTGTPITQGEVDLFSQFKFLSPKILGYSSFYTFANNHLIYSDKYPGLIVETLNKEYLANKIKPYVYQITSEECQDLPEKIYSAKYFNMTEEQREYYQIAKEEILSCPLAYFEMYDILRLFSVLQQITCGFWNRRVIDNFNFRERQPKEFKFIEFNHERTAVLKNIVEEIPENEKILIWCKFDFDIEEIKTTLSKKYNSDAISIFSGNQKGRDRQLDKFRNESKFLIINEAAGSHALTLNESCYSIFYNNSFKYSVRAQAEKRNHRHGQTRKVHYIDIVCLDSIDGRIQSAIYHKKNVADEFREEISKIKDTKRIKNIIKKL